MQALARPDRRALGTTGLVIVGGATALFLAGGAASGNLLPTLAVAGVVGVAVTVVSPQVVLVAVLVLSGTVLPDPIYRVHYGLLSTDVVQLLIVALLGAWVVWTLAGNALPSPYARPMAVFVVALVAGTLVTHVRGSSLEAIGEPVLTYAAYLLVLPLATLIGSRGEQRQFECLVVGITTAACLYVVIATAAELPLPEGNTTNKVYTLTSSVAVERVRLNLLAPLFLTTILVVARAIAEGLTWRRLSQLALFATVFLISFDRSTWAPLFLSTFLVAIFRPGARRRLGFVRTLAPLITLGGILFAVASGGTLGTRPQAISDRLESMVQPEVLEEGSYTIRQDENEAAIRALRRDPILGVGIERPYGLRWRVFYDDPPRVRHEDHVFIHNSLLRLWLHLGALGVIAFVYLGWVVVRTVVAARRLLPPTDGVRNLAAGCAYFGYALQSLFSGSVLVRPTVVAVACTLVLVAIPVDAPGEAPLATDYEPV